MRVATLLTCLWPGLVKLWRGNWKALVLAVGFAAVLDLLLAATFVWPELLPPSSLPFAWLAVGGYWCFAVWQGFRLRANMDKVSGETNLDLFIQAQGEYLLGNWYEAESTLQRLLAVNSGDVEATLLLATMYRRTHRYKEARDLQKTLSRMDGTQPWRTELDRESQLLKQNADKKPATTTNEVGVANEAA